MVASILPVSLQNVSVRKGGKPILGPLDLHIGETGCSIVIGPNGAGKTTLLRLMHGLEQASSGSVKWSVRKSDAYARQSFVFQTPVMLRRSVIENIAYPLYVRGVGHRTARATAEDWTAKVGLEYAAHRNALVLSGGEKQKLAMARALITAPDILFLDEPTTNLDGASTQEIEALIRVATEEGTRIVMATHDFGQASRLASEILFMYHGAIHERAAVSDFFDGPKTKEATTFIRGDLLI
ncbi:ATP-binding cassette domain-containing protein [uncultured Sneathiella sp.]|uniref:energy-coupling factor ABC transporter ATP-binding protein n=1 Tax=uncultured Sneathiella sp. TaxID=879315 RepID=UPI0030EEB3BA|tara:strand:+ start:33208 stop:33924 length:717 start_codon:yes stop_codon:yes gene_type:complete